MAVTYNDKRASLNNGGENKQPVADVVIPLVIPSGADTVTIDATLNGETRMLFIKLPATMTATNCTLSVTDAGSYELYNSGAKAKNATYPIVVQRPMNGVVSFALTGDGGNEAADRTCEVKVYYV